MSSDRERRAEVLELYKLAVEMADRVSARRGTANAYFLTVQTTFVALTGLGFPKLSGAPWWVPAPLLLAGLTLSAAWWMQLRSYRDLNTAKFRGINKLEEDLPARIFTDEWEQLRRGPVHGWGRRYAELGTSERVIPAVFAAAHLVVFVGTLTA